MVLRKESVAGRIPAKCKLGHEVPRHPFDPQDGQSQRHRSEYADKQGPLHVPRIAALAEEPKQNRHDRGRAENQRDDVPHRGIDDVAHDGLQPASPDERRRCGQ